MSSVGCKSNAIFALPGYRSTSSVGRKLNAIFGCKLKIDMAVYGWKVRMSPRRTIQAREDDNDTRYIPTLITDSGNEVVIFDEALVNKGSKRWNLILCGQFVRYEMNIHKLSLLLMCRKGMGNFEFARVLVEMDAKKEFKKEIVIQCRDRNNNVKDNVKNEEHVMVEKMTKRFETTDEGKEDQNSGKHEKNGKGMHQGYRSNGNNAVKSQGTRNNNFSQWKHNGNGRSRVPDIRRHEYRNRQVDAENLNKEGNEDNDQEIRILKKRMIVDKFLNQKMQPTLIELMTWSKDMIYYFKEKWEEDRQKERNKGLVCFGNKDLNVMISPKRQFDKVFQDWEWVSNMDVCNKGCRIVIGWDNETNICKWEALVYCWDMNVNLYPNEHSCGTSIMNSDMMEFQDCLNALEVEDICSSGIHFTWIKNLHKANLGIMTGFPEKLDRIIFSNYITEKQEFILIVKEKWNQNIHGQKMYQVVKKLKSLKVPLKRLGWSKGNLFNKVECLRKQLQEIQTSVDDDPYDHTLRLKEAKLMEEFCEAEVRGKVFEHRTSPKLNGCIPQLFLKHFENFLGSTYLVQDIESSGTLFKKKLSFVAADKIIADISDAEIKRALFDIEMTQSPWF
ncbi:hypothetical protein Tco_0232781 [Tanacetum coccineum]